MNYFSLVSVPKYTFDTASVLLVLAGVFSTYMVIGLPFFSRLITFLSVKTNLFVPLFFLRVWLF